MKVFTVFQIDRIKSSRRPERLKKSSSLFMDMDKDFALTESVFSQVHIRADQKQVNVITSVIGE